MLDLAGTESVDQPRSAPDVEARLQVQLIDPDGRARIVPCDGTRAHGFRVTSQWKTFSAARIERAWEIQLSIVSYQEHEGLGLRVVLPLDAVATRFMIPGLIYGENRRSDCRVRYPRVAFTGSEDSLTSDRWAFRIDRASHGVVLGWSASACLAIATAQNSALGLSGLAFGGGDHSFIAVDFPAREEPVSYRGHDAAAPAEVITHQWRAGEIATVRLTVFELPPEPHAYDPVLRALYQRDRESGHELAPWTSTEEAAALAAHGLLRWHYRPEYGILAETVAFHRETDESASVTGDREAMHVAWLSGAPPAYALLVYGRQQGIADYVRAGASVLDTIASGLAPCGSFWGRWTPNGWDGGWNGHRDRVHSRTIAEATLFMIRALRAERDAAIEHPGWEEAIRSNLQVALASQRDDGAFPALINGQTGTAESWSGASGLLWIAALVEGARYPSPLLGEGQGLGLDPIRRAGEYYARFIGDEDIYGAPEDVDLAPSSEDGYNALIAYLALYEAMDDQRWLDLAKRAADWMLSFRMSHNLTFPVNTILDTYGYRSRGADIASPRNPHLHVYGLICLPELVRLSMHTGDEYYAQRARDSLANALQFIAREDGDFNARKGMVTERFYHCGCYGPKGAILPVSHAWSAGLVLYACQAGMSLDA